MHSFVAYKPLPLGYRRSTGCVRETDRKRGSFTCFEKKMKIHMHVVRGNIEKRKLIFFFFFRARREGRKGGGGGKQKSSKAQKVGKCLQIARVLLPYNKSNSSLLLLPVFDGQPCPERCPGCQQRGREARLPIILRHVIHSHTTATDILSIILYFHRSWPGEPSNNVQLHSAAGW